MLLIIDPNSPDELSRAHRAVDELVHLAQASCSGVAAVPPG